MSHLGHRTETDSIESQISSKTSRGEKGQYKKDAIKHIISDSQVSSYFPYRWSPVSQTINIYFYLFLYLYLTRITINNSTPHLKSLKSQNRRAALERPAMKVLQLIFGRSTLALRSALVPQTLSCSVCVEDSLLIKALA